MDRCIAVLVAFAACVGFSLSASAREASSPPVFERMSITDGLGRSITYYVARPRTTGPLLLVIQGSGCDPVAEDPQAGPMGMPAGIAQLAGGRFTVVVVEKPFASRQEPKDRGTAVNCGRRFNEDFTAERWVEALVAAASAARRQPYVDPSRALVFGHSEGARMAAMVAARDSRFTDVVVIAGGGGTQAYDTLISAYQRGATTAEKLSNLETAQAQIQAIFAKPDSVDDFIWGHPYRRWSSFFRVSTTMELSRSKARVYIVSGTADQSVPFLSTQLAVADLIVSGRDVTVRRVPDADHSLRTFGAKGSAETLSEYGKALDWFWAR